MEILKKNIPENKFLTLLPKISYKKITITNTVVIMYLIVIII